MTSRHSIDEARPVRGTLENLTLPVAPCIARIEPQKVWVGVERDGGDEISQPMAEILEEYRYMISSRSWRATAPLRWIVTFAKRVRQGLYDIVSH